MKNNMLLVLVAALGVAAFFLLGRKPQVIHQTQPIAGSSGTGPSVASPIQSGNAKSKTDSALQYAKAGTDLLSKLFPKGGGGAGGGNSGGNTKNNGSSPASTNVKTADSPTADSVTSQIWNDVSQNPDPYGVGQWWNSGLQDTAAQLGQTFDPATGAFSDFGNEMNSGYASTDPFVDNSGGDMPSTD